MPGRDPDGRAGSAPAPPPSGTAAGPMNSPVAPAPDAGPGAIHGPMLEREREAGAFLAAASTGALVRVGGSRP